MKLSQVVALDRPPFETSAPTGIASSNAGTQSRPLDGLAPKRHPPAHKTQASETIAFRRFFPSGPSGSIGNVSITAKRYEMSK